MVIVPALQITKNVVSIGGEGIVVRLFLKIEDYVVVRLVIKDIISLFRTRYWVLAEVFIVEVNDTWAISEAIRDMLVFKMRGGVIVVGLLFKLNDFFASWRIREDWHFVWTTNVSRDYRKHSEVRDEQMRFKATLPQGEDISVDS